MLRVSAEQVATIVFRSRGRLLKGLAPNRRTEWRCDTSVGFEICAVSRVIWSSVIGCCSMKIVLHQSSDVCRC